MTMMTMMMICVVSVSISIIIAVVVAVGRRRVVEGKGLLPPGTMGWPYLGETLQMYSQDPSEFFAAKLKKYGAVFKTHILGCPCVMVSSPEAAKFVLRGDTLFKPTFPASKERMLGPHAIFFHQGPYHLKLRRLVLRAFSSPASLRPIVPRVDALAQSTLATWAATDSGHINTYQNMKQFAFDVALLSILGPQDAHSAREDLKRCYYVLEKGYNSMPINIPGTLFHKAMSARVQISRILTAILASRRSSSSSTGDLLASFMAEEEGLTDEQIVDNIIGVIFAARDTTASVLTWAVKYLHDNPGVLEAVAEEQRAVEGGLTWAHTKSAMPVTSRVIQETLRCASVLSFTFREAVEDVHYDGYLIPKGWKVLPLFRNIHHNPDLFPDPHRFDPSRFKEGPPKAHTYMPFGSGSHSCPGNELAKIEMLALLHHLTTKYTWTLVGPQEGIQYGPFALPKNGLPIALHPITFTSS